MFAGPLHRHGPQVPRKVTGTLSNITRVESWSYLRPVSHLAPHPEPIGEPDYTFIGDRAELGVRVDGEAIRSERRVQLRSSRESSEGRDRPRRLGEWAHSISPPPALSYSYQLYLSELALRVKSRDDGPPSTLGRMSFHLRRRVGCPGTPDRSGGARAVAVAIGGQLRVVPTTSAGSMAAEWISIAGGALTAAAFLPTQGGFEESDKPLDAQGAGRGGWQRFNWESSVLQSRMAWVCLPLSRPPPGRRGRRQHLFT